MLAPTSRSRSFHRLPSRVKMKQSNDCPLDRYCGAWNVSLTGVYCPIQSGPEAATRVGKSRCQMSRSWQSVTRMLPRRASGREGRHCYAVPTPGCCSFCRQTSRRATCSKTGVGRLHVCCCATARIAAGRQLHDIRDRTIFEDATNTSVGDMLQAPVLPVSPPSVE